jgi:outer membrane lipase/esterase
MTWRLTFIGFATALAMAGCGGGDPVTAPQVYVAGDSLNDVGVFGFRFTVQSANAGSPYKVWTEHVASAAGVASLCAAYNGAASFAPVANCTGHAVGGAQINPVNLKLNDKVVTGVDIGEDSIPLSIVQQIRNIAQGRTFASKDLILVDGGGNDANALATSLLQGLAGNSAAIGAYATILKDLLDDSAVDAAVAQGDLATLIQLGGAYMQAAADMLSSAIKSELLAKGAQRVVVLNLPDLSKAPALNTQPDDAKGIVRAWSQAMNAGLQTKLGSESKVLIVDFYSALDGWVSNPSSGTVGLASLSNVTSRACGSTDIPLCTDSGLDASGPSDWRTHMFADDLHATPFGNQLLANFVQARIATKGWN